MQRSPTAPKDKPQDWIPVSIALIIFFVAAIRILFFTAAPVPPVEPLKRGKMVQDTLRRIDSPELPREEAIR